MTLESDSGYIVATPASAAVTIVDDDAPFANFTGDQSAGEGTTVTLKVVLDGDVQTYPVTIPYTVSGTATNPSDHNAVSGSLEIPSGREGSITFNVVDDGLGDPNETVIFTMGTPTPSSVSVGAHSTHTVTIAEANVDPQVTLSAVQATEPRTLLITGDGTVVVQTTVTDPNPLDTHTYDWSGTNASLVDVLIMIPQPSSSIRQGW